MTQASPEFFAEMQSRAMEAFSVVNEMNHRVIQELLGMSASSAKEGLRTYSELQSATVEAMRAVPTAAAQAEGFSNLQENPLAWYEKSLLAVVEGSQKAFRLVEANAQVVTRSAERLQASADRTGQEIHEVMTSSVGRMKEIFASS